MKILLAEHAGFCPGVRRAAEAVLSTIASDNPPKRILTLGNLIHNPVFLEELRSHGVFATDEAGAERAALESEHIGKTLLFCAHTG